MTTKLIVILSLIQFLTISTLFASELSTQDCYKTAINDLNTTINNLNLKNSEVDKAIASFSNSTIATFVVTTLLTDIFIIYSNDTYLLFVDAVKQRNTIVLKVITALAIYNNAATPLGKLLALGVLRSAINEFENFKNSRIAMLTNIKNLIVADINSNKLELEMLCSDDTKCKNPLNDKKYLTFQGGFCRSYIVHIPANYQNLLSPLVIGFHGGGGDGRAMDNEAHLEQKSELAGFIVALPDAYSPTKKWNIGPRVNPKDQPPTDDIAFIKAMISEIKGKFSIDGARIYTTGMSDGGMMAFRTACDMSDVVAAVGTVATTLMYHECNPKRPVPIINFHGTVDRFVPYDGGYSDPTLPEIYKVQDLFRSQSEVLNFWLNKDSCTSQSSVSYQNKSATCVSYSNCALGSEYVQCKIDGGTHTWPGGTCPAKSQAVCNYYISIVGQYTNDISATDAIWDFFKKHPMVNAGTN